MYSPKKLSLYALGYTEPECHRAIRTANETRLYDIPRFSCLKVNFHMREASHNATGKTETKEGGRLCQKDVWYLSNHNSFKRIMWHVHTVKPTKATCDVTDSNLSSTFSLSSS